MRVLLFIALAAIAALVGTPLSAEEAMTPDCVATANKIGKETNSTYVRTTSLIIDFKQALHGDELSVRCDSADRTDWSVYVGWVQNASPPIDYYKTVGRAGGVLTGESEATLINSAQTCVREALGHKSELADALTDKAKLECQAFTRNGGSASISIFVRKESDERTEYE